MSVNTAFAVTFVKTCEASTFPFRVVWRPIMSEIHGSAFTNQAPNVGDPAPASRVREEFS